VKHITNELKESGHNVVYEEIVGDELREKGYGGEFKLFDSD
jgi:hypothetical protein